MKVRIKGNAVRFRLTRSEVERFAHEGVIKETTDFGDDNHFTYVLQRAFEPRLKATFKNNILMLLVPEALADEWTDTDKVGIEDSEGPLTLLVEKDFRCLENVAEDQSDNYPNPLAEKDHERRE